MSKEYFMYDANYMRIIEAAFSIRDSWKWKLMK